MKRRASFTCALLLGFLPALGQPAYNGRVPDPISAYQDHSDDRRGQSRQDEHSRPNRNLDNGLRQGGHGGQYGERDRDDHRDDQHRGGIGPGKGALIGGAGGAVLGAVFGRSLKGSLIGGATGAGIGAIVGDVAQNNRDSHPRH